MNSLFANTLFYLKRISYIKKNNFSVFNTKIYLNINYKKIIVYNIFLIRIEFIFH